MTWFFFFLMSAMALGGGLGVVAARNVVHSALFLLLSLLAVAGLYVLLLTEFLALVQIFIYGGAIIIVLLFAIMLTSLPGISPHLRQRPVAPGGGGRTSRLRPAYLRFPGQPAGGG